MAGNVDFRLVNDPAHSDDVPIVQTLGQDGSLDLDVHLHKSMSHLCL